jgi:hypothetical protein
MRRALLTAIAAAPLSLVGVAGVRAQAIYVEPAPVVSEPGYVVTEPGYAIVIEEPAYLVVAPQRRYVVRETYTAPPYRYQRRVYGIHGGTVEVIDRGAVAPVRCAIDRDGFERCY